DHSSIILPHSHDEADHLHSIESRFDSLEAWPEDPARNSEARMIEALRALDELPKAPVLIAHHPSRSATGLGEYGMTEPKELRAWNDAAPISPWGWKARRGTRPSPRWRRALALPTTPSILATPGPGAFTAATPPSAATIR